MAETNLNQAEIKIDSEFENLVPPLTDEEYNQLECNIKEEGCREPLITWNGILIDGHNRYKICTEHNLPYVTVPKDFENRDNAKIWIINNQFGRRNLHQYNRVKLALKLEEIFASKAKENKQEAIQIARRENHRVLLHQNSDATEHLESNEYTPSKQRVVPVNTNKEIAKIAGVSHDTVARVRKIEEMATPELKEDLLTNKISINGAFNKIKPDKPYNGNPLTKSSGTPKKKALQEAEGSGIENIDKIISDMSPEKLSADYKRLYQENKCLQDKIQNLEADNKKLRRKNNSAEKEVGRLNYIIKELQGLESTNTSTYKTSVVSSENATEETPDLINNEGGQ
ncbi:MAG: hypothetical protein A2287_09435 [Candidatus Melainabacteria bacterium RIFOXYA12_FULL_32_12]|nr:MAG: hypothetical protein A2287_09435 [Candidatus Melainabacteria bacterium RIFOXYA12_FULL_32_12]